MSKIDHPEMLTRGLVAHVVRFVFLCKIPILTPLIIMVYARLFNADFYHHHLREFPNLLAFFLRDRDLSAKMRSVALEEGMVSPAESKIAFWDKLSHNDTMPIKGAGFTVSKLLGFDAPHFQTGIVFYLSPGNYHHVHAPCDMTVEGYFEIPGKLESVAPSLIKKMPQLFAENLRHVVLARTSDNRRLAIVLVGAKNVGNIHCQKLAGFEAESGISYKKGELLGYFTLGSTVVMLLDEDLPSLVPVGSPIDVLDSLERK